MQATELLPWRAHRSSRFVAVLRELHREPPLAIGSRAAAKEPEEKDKRSSATVGAYRKLLGLSK